jgi:hypothetical protein
MEKTAKNKKAPEVKPNSKVVDKMPKPPVVVVPGEKKERKPRVAKTGSKFVFIKGPDEGAKMPLQCKQIIEILAKVPEGMDRADLLKAMTGVIATRQPIERILAFYQSRLVAGKYVRVEATVATKVEAA